MLSVPNFSTETVVFFTALSAFTFLASLILLPWLILALPADYFVEKRRQPLDWKKGGKVLRPLVLLLKNLVGVLLFTMGLALLFLPGQGLLTILAGLVLIDFPGKFGLLRNLARRESVLRSLNWMRRKGNKKPFVT